MNIEQIINTKKVCRSEYQVEKSNKKKKIRNKIRNKIRKRRKKNANSKKERNS